MWSGVNFSSIGENVTKDDLLQFQTSLNRHLGHTLSHVRSSQIINIEANKITTSEAKIGTAQIETLTVGGNVIMGPDAEISWSKVTDAPTIPVLPSYITSTKITSTTIESPIITAGTITGAIVNGGTINVTTDINVGERINLRLNDNDYAVLRNIVITGGSSLFIGRSTTKTGWPLGNLERVDMFAGILYVYNHLYASSSIDTGGSINFSTNLTKNGIAISANTSGAHNHTATTNNNGSHTHGIPSSEYVATYTSGGTFLGYRQFATDGGHTHFITTTNHDGHTHSIS